MLRNIMLSICIIATTPIIARAETSEEMCNEHPRFCKAVKVFLNYPWARETSAEIFMRSGKLENSIEQLRNQKQVDFFLHKLKDKNGDSLATIVQRDFPRFAIQLEILVNRHTASFKEIKSETINYDFLTEMLNSEKFKNQLNLETAPYTFEQPQQEEPQQKVLEYASAQPTFKTKLDERASLKEFLKKIKEKTEKSDQAKVFLKAIGNKLPKESSPFYE